MAVGRGEFKVKSHGSGSPPVRAQRIARSLISSTLENGRNAHAAGGADRDQSALGPGFIENFREGGDDASAGRGERVADRKAASLHVEFGPIDVAEGSRQSQLVAAEYGIGPGFECAHYLPRESLVDLVEIEILTRPSPVTHHP